MQIDPEEYRALDLRAHALLADVPLHDVWAVDLPGRGGARPMLELRALLAGEELARINPAVRLLFALRRWLGRLSPADREPPGAAASSFARRLGDADRAATLVAPGTREGPFQVLYVFPEEALGEVQNATVHAFSVHALRDRPGGHRLYWAIYVRPVGAVTAWYMRGIDPFRRRVIYPALLRHLRERWAEAHPASTP
jgi:hypothetical protein